MKKAEEWAKMVLKEEYFDFNVNEWHYKRQFDMLVLMYEHGVTDAAEVATASIVQESVNGGKVAAVNKESIFGLLKDRP